MKIFAENPKTGEKYEAQADNADKNFIGSMSQFSLSDDVIKSMIDNLNVSADTKSLLYSFSKVTITAGKFILKIGKKIIDFICKLFNEFPSATFGVIFGAIAGFLVASIPIIGVVFGPLFTPIAMALGLLGGLKEDVKDKALARKVAEVNASFSPLNV